MVGWCVYVIRFSAEKNGIILVCPAALFWNLSKLAFSLIFFAVFPCLSAQTADPFFRMDRVVIKGFAGFLQYRKRIRFRIFLLNIAASNPIRR